MRPVPGLRGYFATSRGEVISVRSGAQRILKSRLHKGYLHVAVKYGEGRRSTRKVPVHQLVLLAYEGARPSPLHVSRHLNGDAQDNAPSNLAWGTTAQNAADAMKHGTAVCLRRGDHHNRTVLSFEAVLSIRACQATAASEAARLGVSAAYIRSVRSGRVRIAA
ncbi:HNH endonuclease [Methylobacterium fujisawaense]|jgi:hypothetical protein